MKRKEKLIIPFVGLKEGKHEFEFKINETFFKEFEYSIIESADFSIDLIFDKKKTMFELNFQIEGTIYTDCHRCGDTIEIDVRENNTLIVKFGEEPSSFTDDILYISNEEYELDLTNIIYEFTNLLMPKKPVHKDIQNCNQKAIETLNKYSESKNYGSDPRWEALSKLK